MSRIEKLIKRLCPDGVILARLVEVANIQYGFPFESKLFTQDKSKIPLIRIRDVKTGKSSTYYTGDYVEAYIIKRGDILVGMDGNFNLERWNDRDGLLNQRVCKIYSKSENEIILNGFLFHLLGPLFKEIELSILGSTVKHLSAQIINQIVIPIPPIEIQNEIAKILDKFTYLKAELEAELEARKTQYEHYREALLSFEAKNVEWKTLGEIGELIRGTGLQKKDFTQSGIGCIHYGQIYTHYGTYATVTKSFVHPDLAKKLKHASTNDLIIAGVSENVEDVCKAVVWLGKEDICVSGDSFVFKHHQNGKYLGYILQLNRFKEYKKQHAIGAKVTRLRSDKLKNYTIPIPPLEEQERIVAILDKFDALVNDLSSGLPAEIQARRKQYEYYRNKLLTFKHRTHG